MTKRTTGRLIGGLRDAPPSPAASRRHLTRFLLISAGIASATFIQARHPVAPARNDSRVSLYLTLIGIELLLLWFVSAGVRARGNSIRDLIGERWRVALDPVRDLIVAFVFSILLGYIKLFLLYWLGHWRSNTVFLLPTTRLDSTAWCLVAITAGVCEELVYRGYLLRQLWNVSRSLPLAIFLQAVVFGSGHIYQGWQPAVVTVIYGLALGLLAAWRRSIIPGAIAHAALDVIGGLPAS